jgi:hypothetical protein
MEGVRMQLWSERVWNVIRTEYRKTADRSHPITRS